MSEIVWEDDDIIHPLLATRCRDPRIESERGLLDLASLTRIQVNNGNIQELSSKVCSLAYFRFLEYWKWFRDRRLANTGQTVFYASFFLWLKKTEPVAYLMVSDVVGLTWIDMIEVFEDYWCMGLGTQIVCFAINELGVNALGVHKNNEVAIHLYEKFGFKRCEDDVSNPKCFIMKLS